MKIIDRKNKRQRGTTTPVRFAVFIGMLLLTGNSWALTGSFTVKETYKVTMSYHNFGSDNYGATDTFQATQSGTISVTNDTYTMLNKSGVLIEPETRSIYYTGSGVDIPGGTVMPYFADALGKIYGIIYLGHFIIKVPLHEAPDGSTEIPAFYRNDTLDTTGPDFANLSSYGKLTGSSLVVTVTSTSSFVGTGAPQIVVQPGSLELGAGASATFCVSALGSAVIKYKWQRLVSAAWVDVSGATSACYTIPSVSPSDAGTYRVVVSNTRGSATSESAVLAVRMPDLTNGPSSNVSPPSLAAGENFTVSGSVRNIGSTAAGSSLTRFYLSSDQMVDGADLVLGSSALGSIGVSGSQSFSKTFPTSPGLTPGDYYVCWEIDSGGTVAESDESNNVAFCATALTVGPPVSITLDGPNGGETLQVGALQEIRWSSTAGAGASVDLRVIKGGLPWRTLALSTPNDGSYDWTVPAAVSIGGDFRILVCSSSDPAICDESDANFAISQTGLAVDALDTDGDGMPDGYEDAAGLLRGDPADALEDRDGDGVLNIDEFRTASDCNDANSLFGPRIRSFDRAANGEISLAWEAAAGFEFCVERSTNGSGPWSEVEGSRCMADGSPPSLTFAGVPGASVELFRVCAYGLSQSAPRVVQHPVERVVEAGEHATFSVLVEGAPFCRFEWQRSEAGSPDWVVLGDGAVYQGVRESSMTICGAVPGLSGGEYRCVVTNEAGSSASNAAVLTVQGTPPP